MRKKKISQTDYGPGFSKYGSQKIYAHKQGRVLENIWSFLGLQPAICPKIALWSLEINQGYLPTAKTLSAFLNSDLPGRLKLHSMKHTCKVHDGSYSWTSIVLPHILRIPRISHALSSLHLPEQRLLLLLNSRDAEPKLIPFNLKGCLIFLFVCLILGFSR